MGGPEIPSSVSGITAKRGYEGNKNYKKNRGQMM